MFPSGVGRKAIPIVHKDKTKEDNMVGFGVIGLGHGAQQGAID